MFCLPGHSMLRDVASYAYTVARDISYAKHTTKSDNGDGSYSYERSGATRAESDYHRCWMISNFCRHLDTFACSIDGTILRVTEDFFEHADIFPGEPFQFPSLNSNSKAHEIFKNPKVDWHHFSNRFLFIDLHEGGFRRKMNIDWHTEELKVAFGEDGFQRLSPKLASLTRAAQRFLGWSICFNDKDVDLSEEEMLKKFGIDQKTMEAINSNALPAFRTDFNDKGDKKLKLGLVRDAYREVYPNGHENTGDSDKTAFFNTIDAVDFSFSMSTFLRALGKK